MSSMVRVVRSCKPGQRDLVSRLVRGGAVTSREQIAALRIAARCRDGGDGVAAATNTGGARRIEHRRSLTISPCTTVTRGGRVALV
jgi:hypothetical protein